MDLKEKVFNSNVKKEINEQKLTPKILSWKNFDFNLLLIINNK
jgi:hypothetical protein